MVFEPIAPAGNGNGLGVVQETVHDGAGGGDVAQKFAPAFAAQYVMLPSKWLVLSDR